MLEDMLPVDGRSVRADGEVVEEHATRDEVDAFGPPRRAAVSPLSSQCRNAQN